jgi:hypothetical protein
MKQIYYIVLSFYLLFTPNKAICKEDYFSKQALQEDFKQFRQPLEQNHADLYEYASNRQGATCFINSMN